MMVILIECGIFLKSVSPTLKMNLVRDSGTPFSEKFINFFKACKPACLLVTALSYKSGTMERSSGSNLTITSVKLDPAWKMVISI